jgi:hypothetical protein
MDKPTDTPTSHPLVQAFAELPQAQQLTLLTHLLEPLTTQQLAQVLSGISKQKLGSLISKLLLALDTDRLHDLIEQAEATIDQIEVLGDRPEKAHFTVVSKRIRDRFYAYVRNPDRSVEVGIGRIIFEIGKVYQLQDLTTQESRYLRCLRFYVPNTFNVTQDRKALMEVEFLTVNGDVIARQTYEFPQCMQDVFSSEQWQIEELESFETQPLSTNRLDVTLPAQITASASVPPNFAASVSKTLQQWIEISQPSSGGQWTLQEAQRLGHRTLLDGSSREILTYAYKEHRLMLRIPPEMFLGMLRKICQEALQSDSRSHQDLARPLLVRLMSAKCKATDSVLQYTFSL